MSSAKVISRPASSSTVVMEVTTNSNGFNGNGIGGEEGSTTVKTNGSKVVSGRRRFGGENGFEEGGGYMAVKKAKLDNQFNQSTRVFGADGDADGLEIFKGVSIYINGYTDPPENELRERFIKHGGTFHPYSSSKTTYVVATNLSVPSKRLYGAKTIKPEWITESIAAGTALDTRKYKLYDLNQEKNQMTLTQLIEGGKKALPTVVQNSGTSDPKSHSTSLQQPQEPDLNVIINGNVPSLICDTTVQDEKEESVKNGDVEDTVDHVSESEEEFLESSQDFVASERSSNSLFPSSTSTAKENGIDSEKNERSSEEQIQESEKSSVTSSEINDLPTKEVVNGISPSKQTSTNKIKTATDEGFIEDFFGRSRLHLISEQKKEMQVFIGNLRKSMESSKPNFPNLAKFMSEIESRDNMNRLTHSDTEVVLMHIDLDCFFASVGLLSRPQLKGKPIVVTHSTGKGQDSKSDIACASYEARKYGVRNGMWVGQAKQLCPELEVIPYDFEEYRRVSKLFFEAVAGLTLDIEPMSVDEMVIDATSTLNSLPGSTPQELAEFIRKIILAETNCPASVGIGSNKLLAKLAVKLAKPDGVHHLTDSEASTHIQGLQARDLPGIGWSNEDKLKDKFGVETCGDLLKVPLKDLKSMFGEKTAEKMHSLCRGIDTSELKFGFDRPKSISVDVNFGIRFAKEDDVTNFLINLCKEVSTRAERIQARSTHFTLKLLLKKKGAGDPLKPGGHGIVDSMTRSRSILTPTRNWQELYKTACSLTRLMRLLPTDYRGVGITLSDLTFDCDKANKKSVQRTLTEMPISRAQQMLSISQKKTKSVSTTTVAKPEENMTDNVTPDSDPLAPFTSPEEPTSSVEVILSEEDWSTTTAGDVTHQSVGTDTESNPSNLPVDIEILRQLPRDIAEEQCRLYGINPDLLDAGLKITDPQSVDDAIESVVRQSAAKGEIASYYDNIETVDQSFLQALPESVRQDVLIELQQAKGRRNVNDATSKFDDQQPCSSKQALERDKKRLEEQQQNEQIVMELENEENNMPEQSTDDLTSTDDQVTPVISYGSKSSIKPLYDPNQFWDNDSYWQALPRNPVDLPALNSCYEIADVRNMIRMGLEEVSDPTEADVKSLEEYFRELLSRGFMKQTKVLMKFLYRRVMELEDYSKWTPVLTKIIDDTQETCKKLHHGELELE